MKLILYRWQANNEQALYDALIKAGHEITCYDKACKHYTRDMTFASGLIELIHRTESEGIISFNYFPIISLVCDTANIKYFSWVYDNPHLTLYARTTGLSCNRIGIFDRRTVEELSEIGIDTVLHLPLAVDINRFEKIIRKAPQNSTFYSDVSFVGSLYNDGHNYFDNFYSGGVSDELTEIITSSLFKSDISEERQKFTSLKCGLDFAIQCMNDAGLNLGDDYYPSNEKVALATVFERKITSIERDTLMRKLAKMPEVKFVLYTGSKTDIPNKGTINYEKEMPIVFNRSKININLTLKSIHSGVPLRVLDIMACGGFVLSNRQPELEEYFVEDVEIVYFDGIANCEEKIRYYLEHDDERRKIAEAGKKKVSRFFSYEKMLAQLL